MPLVFIEHLRSARLFHVRMLVGLCTHVSHTLMAYFSICCFAGTSGQPCVSKARPEVISNSEVLVWIEGPLPSLVV